MLAIQSLKNYYLTVSSYQHLLISLPILQTSILFQGFDINKFINIYKFSTGMSKRKQDKKGSKKQKDIERQKMQQQQAKRQQQRQQAQKRIQVLENSGILDAYEYFLRAICKNGLPEANIFQFAAQQILKYQKKMKQSQGKKQEIKNYNKSALDQSASRIEKSEQKLKPSLLPFKGEPNEEALKALKKSEKK